MNTPILNFINEYNQKNIARMHMPGHKGCELLGVERYDITEIKGADALFEAEGIIGESEANATALFGSGRTVYSTEGSSQCVRAMLTLAALVNKQESPLFLAGRNAHKAFVYGAAMLDAEVSWLYPEGNDGLCGCRLEPSELERALSAEKRAVTAVYVTSPDYLGNMLDIKGLAEVCHAHNTLLLVDNAHGAYLHFLEKPVHPLDLGADMCSDSAHKTFSVVTGGAYLHISRSAPDKLRSLVKVAMEMYGSTSPSYITLASLDAFNAELDGGYAEALKETIGFIDELKSELREAGFRLVESDPLKLTIEAPDGMTGDSLAEILRKNGGEPEYADRDYLVLMLTPDNRLSDLEVIRRSFLGLSPSYEKTRKLVIPRAEARLSIRQAVFSAQTTVSVDEAVGEICAAPSVACPPAIPVVISGEVISPEAVAVMKSCGIHQINIVGHGDVEIRRLF